MGCEAGFYCPAYASFYAGGPYGEDYRQIPCGKGTYNLLTERTSVADCLPCAAGKACEREAIGDLADAPSCAAGYFCASGADSRYPSGAGTTLSGPCPRGYWCGEATETPEPCAAGTYQPQERATSDSFCLPCPPGYMCEDPATYELTVKVDAGLYGDDGLTTASCGGAGATGVYCPIGSQFELYCPMGFYQGSQGRGYCAECPAGSYCMTGSRNACAAGYYCP